MVRHDTHSGLDAPEVGPAAPATPARRRFSGAEWDRLVSIGFFGPDERLELIDGEVQVMSPIGDAHAVTTTKVARALERACGPARFAWAQNPLSVGDDRVYPDVVVLRGAPDDYALRSPRPADALLVVEVADSTLAFDLGRKAQLYARAGVAEYWVVSLPDRAVVMHRSPRKGRGRSPARFEDVSTVTQGKVLLPGGRRGIALASLFPAK